MDTVCKNRLFFLKVEQAIRCWLDCNPITEYSVSTDIETRSRLEDLRNEVSSSKYAYKEPSDETVNAFLKVLLTHYTKYMADRAPDLWYEIEGIVKGRHAAMKKQKDLAAMRNPSCQNPPKPTTPASPVTAAAAAAATTILSDVLKAPAHPAPTSIFCVDTISTPTPLKASSPVVPPTKKCKLDIHLDNEDDDEDIFDFCCPSVKRKTARIIVDTSDLEDDEPEDIEDEDDEKNETPLDAKYIHHCPINKK